MIGRLAVLAALAGSGIGAAVVLADDARDERPAVPVVAAAATPTPAPGGHEPRPRRARGPHGRGSHRRAAVGDPALPAPAAGEDRPSTAGRSGGWDQDRFGWVGADGTFTVRLPEAFAAGGRPAGPKGQPRQFGIQGGRFTHDRRTSARRGRSSTVTWGVTAPDHPRGHPPPGEPAPRRRGRAPAARRQGRGRNRPVHRRARGRKRPQDAVQPDRSAPPSRRAAGRGQRSRRGPDPGPGRR